MHDRQDSPLSASPHSASPHNHAFVDAPDTALLLLLCTVTRCRYIIVEGFLLLEDDASCAMLDDCICIGEEVAWQRRLSRAIAMANGEKDASGMDNYEVRPPDACAPLLPWSPLLPSPWHALRFSPPLGMPSSPYHYLRYHP